jgi:hypothetical protein
MNSAQPFRNLARLITCPFEVGDTLRGSHQKSQVTRGGLSTGNDIANLFVEFKLHCVEPLFAVENLQDQGEIIGVHQPEHALNLRLEQSARLEQSRREQVEVNVKLSGKMLDRHGRCSRDVFSNRRRG